MNQNLCLPCPQSILAIFLHKPAHRLSIQMNTPKAIYEPMLSDIVLNTKTITKEEAEKIFGFFKNNKLFRWSDANNDCEDRANAICILLTEWGIPNYKGWVFGGAYLKRQEGSLMNLWNYHVAAAIPVMENNEPVFYVIDPATSGVLEHISTWAEKVTDVSCSYYLIKDSHYYIFPPVKLFRDNWYKRNKQNFKWTIQGLAGINGVSKSGQAAVLFNKNKIENTEKKFRALLYRKPEELS